MTPPSPGTRSPWPRAAGTRDEVQGLAGLLGRLDLRPVDRFTAELATVLSSRYRLRATVATRLATAAGLGADRFIANNQRDSPRRNHRDPHHLPVDLPDAIGSPPPPRTGLERDSGAKVVTFASALTRSH